ncbi:DUF533 domain-containing protein, partial [Klebsiella pneumoniae]|uniref:DUF533 domain-containing protein n=1 Tax=Klebsiella pneumoniae TaxID=573 RepID=UPI001D0DD470
MTVAFRGKYQGRDQPHATRIDIRRRRCRLRRLEIYYVSCAVIDIDHFMERSYLNALGDALALPK